MWKKGGDEISCNFVEATLGDAYTVLFVIYVFHQIDRGERSR